MTKDEIADVLENIARLLEIKGENPFKLRAYQNAARALETYSGDLAAAAKEGSLAEIDGIGKAIGEKIASLVQDGRLEYYDKLREEFPPDILTLFELQGVGGKTIKVLHETLGVHSITSLERACRDGRVEAVPGFGKKSAAKFLEAIEHRKRHAGQFLLERVSSLAAQFLDDLRAHPDVNQVEIAGSFRRSKPVVRDLDFIVSTKSPRNVMDFFAAHPRIEKVLAMGPTKASAIADIGIPCDLRAVSGSEYPFALAYFTGSKEHNVRLRSMAQERGWTLNEYRLGRADGSDADAPPPIHTEFELYRAFDLDFIPPELRENLGEFDAAARHTLPRLIEWSNLRGTFHNHTTASDGRASLEEMVAAARDLGLDYLGIADHSKSSVQAHGLDEKRLLDQVATIRRLNAEATDGFRIFAGTECDILKDGTLDFSDEILAQLDYVVISVHSAFSMDETAMTQRVIRAMQSPHATMLGHLTGRLLLTRDPYAINIPAIIDAAAETGTVIEINANPRRLELDWAWWPLAKEKGVKCSINPDAHSPAGLAHLLFGVGIARKGWLTRDDVINTLPVKKIEAALQAKRLSSAG